MLTVELKLQVGLKIQKSKIAQYLEETENLNFDVYQPHKNDAGYDVRACISNPLFLSESRRTVIIPTGLFLELDNPEWEIQVRSRSGLSAKYGISVLNSPGTVDFAYRDELKIILHNHSDKTFQVNPGDRIAQICIRPVPTVTIEYVDEINTEINRGGGLGSSGLE